MRDYRDDGSYEGIVLFPNVKYDAINFNVIFRVNTKISEFMYKKEKDYTRLDLSKIRKYNLNKHAFNLLEIVYKNIFRFKLNQYVEFTTEEFKRLVGASSECSNSYFKSNVMIKALSELEKVVGIDVDFALNNSLSHNKIKSVRLYLDCNSIKNKEFIKEYDSVTKHEEKDEIYESLSEIQQKNIDDGKAYIDSITGKYVGAPSELNIPKEIKVPTESKTLGINLLVTIILEKLNEKELELEKKESDRVVHDKKSIKNKLLSLKTYDKYLSIMEKLNLIPIDEYYFDLGYRYFKYKK